jgi:hypothetical protein
LKFFLVPTAVDELAGFRRRKDTCILFKPGGVRPEFQNSSSNLEILPKIRYMYLISK